MRLFLTEIVAVSAVGLAIVLLVTSHGLVDVIGSSIVEPDRDQYCHDRNLTSWSGSKIEGRAWLCLGDGAVELTMVPKQLIPGRVYTAWLLYAQEPTLCQATPCEGAGPGEKSEHWIRARIDGAVADERRTAQLTTTYRGLRLAQGSQVLLVLVDAGEISAEAGLDLAHLILLPPPTLMESATAAPPGLPLDVDGTTGAVVARVLFTLLRPADG